MDSIKFVLHRHGSGEEIDLAPMLMEASIHYGVGETNLKMLCLREPESGLPDIVPAYDDTLYVIRNGHREGPFDVSSCETTQNLENDLKPLEYRISGWMWYFQMESESRELVGQGASKG